MNNIENNSNAEPELGKVGKQNMEAKTEYVKVKATKIASVKPPIEDKIRGLQARGFNYDQIAAMLICQKSLVKQILG